jgi:predicted Zn-dependent protease
MHLGHWTSTIRWKVAFYAIFATALSTVAPAFSKPSISTFYASTEYFIVFGKKPFGDADALPITSTKPSLSLSAWEPAIIKNADLFELGIGAEEVAPDPFLLGDPPDSHFPESEGDSFRCWGGNTVGIIHTCEKSPYYRIFFFKEPSSSRIAEVVKNVDRSSNLSIASDSTNWPPANASLAEVLEKIDSVRAGTQVSRRLATVTKKGKVCGEVWFEPFEKELVASLYRRAALLETSKVRKHIYLGSAYCKEENWDGAWREFEQAYQLNKEDEEVANEIAVVYRAANRDLERCIWLTRYLRVNTDWQRFELAFRERDKIERFYAEEKFRNEKGPNVPWDKEKLPLRVYFPDSKLPDFDNRLVDVFKEAMAEWIVATDGRVDFEITEDKSLANIFCYWQEPGEKYKQYEGLEKAPQGVPYLADIGNTNIYLLDGKLKRADIQILARANGDYECMDRELLHTVCLHEIGHALGIQIHLKNPRDIMFPYICEEVTADELSGRDKDDLNSLYVKHPIIPHAVETYIGLQAECKKLPEEEVLRSVSQASPKQKTADPLESAAILF